MVMDSPATDYDPFKAWALCPETLRYDDWPLHVDEDEDGYGMSCILTNQNQVVAGHIERDDAMFVVNVLNAVAERFGYEPTSP